VTTSSCEAELVCSNVGASYLVWAAQLLEGFRLPGPSLAAELQRNADEVIDVPLLYQDNECYSPDRAGTRQLQEHEAYTC
jgi:hypothetical protein